MAPVGLCRSRNRNGRSAWYERRYRIPLWSPRTAVADGGSQSPTSFTSTNAFCTTEGDRTAAPAHHVHGGRSRLCRESNADRHPEGVQRAWSVLSRLSSTPSSNLNFGTDSLRPTARPGDGLQPAVQLPPAVNVSPPAPAGRPCLARHHQHQRRLGALIRQLGHPELVAPTLPPRAARRTGTEADPFAVHHRHVHLRAVGPGERGRVRPTAGSNRSAHSPLET